MRVRTRAAVVAAAFAFLPAMVHAQEGAFTKKSTIASVGVLLGSGTYDGIGFGASFEKGIVEVAPHFTIGIGALVGFIHKSADGFGAYGYSWNSIPITAIGNVHYQFSNIPKLDVLGGLQIGIQRTSFSYDDGYCGGIIDCSASSNETVVGVRAGGSWAFTPKLSAMAQLGGGSNVPTLFGGLTFRF